MQAMGFLFTLYQAFPDSRQRREIFRAHKGFFNTHPYLASYIIGAVVRAYDQQDQPEETAKFISIAQASFAAVGDQLFWQTLRPALLVAAVVISLKTNVQGALIFLMIYNLFHLGHRIAGIQHGYQRGRDVIYLLKARRIVLLQQAGEILGAFVMGFLPFLTPRFAYSLLIVPLTALFLLLVLKRISPVLIILVVLGILIGSIIITN